MCDRTYDWSPRFPLGKGFKILALFGQVSPQTTTEIHFTLGFFFSKLTPSREQNSPRACEVVLQGSTSFCLETLLRYVCPFCFALSSMKKSLIWSSALYLWEMLFLTSFANSAYVSVKPSGWKHGSQPNVLGPLGSTMIPSVLPVNSLTSSPSFPLW